VTGFDWVVVVLLLLILLKRGGGSGHDNLREVVLQLRLLEQRTSEMRQHLEELERLTGIAADSLIELNLANSPQSPGRDF
jgi:hypothetical protein